MVKPIWKNSLFFLAALGFWFFSFAYAKPFIVDTFLHSLIPDDPNHKRLFNHIFIYSLSPALLCSLGWLFLIKMKVVRGPNLGSAPIHAVRTGLTWAFFYSIFLIGVIYFLNSTMVGLQIPNVWNETGNLFSNTYEEIQYSGLIFLSGLACLRSKYAAALISSLIFAWTHTQYPLEFKALVATMGFINVLSFEKTKNFLTPVAFHIGVDLIASLFLQP